MQLLDDQIVKLLREIGVKEPIEFSVPPKSEMGDLAFGCFGIAKEWGMSPVEAATKVKEKFQISNFKFQIIDEVKAVGPYVNFFLNSEELAKTYFKDANKNFGKSKIGKGKKVLVEFGCPNPLKVFHLGHLKNLITGESIARIYENAGYKVIRVNYQGDVGMHVAKTLWGIEQLKEEFKKVKNKSLNEKVAFLGRAYAFGAKAFEENEQSKEGILDYNEKVYKKDKTIQVVYKMTRKWSLDYFALIYKKLDTKYNKMYFESEVFERGIGIVKAFTKKGVFIESEGAIIFPGSQYGLHDRVFINSKGFPVYEAKELALAEKRYKNYHPSEIIHVVGKEQTDYFKVVFKAMEQVIPESKGKSRHLVGGYLQLKGGKKMSSRTGQVVAGDELLQMVETEITELMKDREIKNKKETIRRITGAVLKYSMLKSNVSQDVAFDMEESMSFTGDSGPYLLYIVARINSILKKDTRTQRHKKQTISNIQYSISKEEKQLLLALAKFSEITNRALNDLDPSQIAKYLFELAQSFNAFYGACPVLNAEDKEKHFRLKLISAVKQTMEQGLMLLGIETVEQM
jgi:arginyl-tRNA synthetase